jgi:hypothetical protein
MPGKHRRPYDRRKVTLVFVVALLFVSAVAGAVVGAHEPPPRTAAASPTASPEWEHRPLPLDLATPEAGAPIVVEREVERERTIVIETMPPPTPGPSVMAQATPPAPTPTPSASPTLTREQRRAERCKKHPHHPRCLPKPAPSLLDLPLPTITVGDTP